MYCVILAGQLTTRLRCRRSHVTTKTVQHYDVTSSAKVLADTAFVWRSILLDVPLFTTTNFAKICTPLPKSLNNQLKLFLTLA